jgi:hypothetical protein
MSMLQFLLQLILRHKLNMLDTDMIQKKKNEFLKENILKKL